MKIRQVFKIKQNYKKVKKRVKKYFQLRNSLEDLSKIMKKLFIFSVSFDEIYYGKKNPKRFLICCLISGLIWLIFLFHLIIICSNYTFSLIDNPKIKYLRAFISLATVIFWFVAFNKSDVYLLMELKNLVVLKIFYYLRQNIKSKYKLNDKNYNLLGILTRIILLIAINCGIIIISLVSLTFFVLMTIWTKQLFWLIETLLIPFYVIAYLSVAVSCLILVKS